MREHQNVGQVELTNASRSNEIGLARRQSRPRRRRLCPDNAKLGGMDRSYVADNARELERLRALISRLSDQDLGSMVNEHWTVAGVLGPWILGWLRAVPRRKAAARRRPDTIRRAGGR